MRKLVRIDKELFDLSRVVYVQLDFDYDGGVALEFDSPQKTWNTFVPLGRLEGTDKRRLKRFRFFAGDNAKLLTAILNAQSVDLASDRRKRRAAFDTLAVNQ